MLESSATAVLLVVFAGVSFFFALCETAMFSLARWQIKQLRESAGWRGQAVYRLLSRPDELLALLAFGNTFAMAGIVFVALWFGHESGGIMEWVALGLGVLLVCEIAPKLIALRAPYKWSLFVAPFLLGAERITRPMRALTRLFYLLFLRVLGPTQMESDRTPSEEEYKELLEFAFQHGALGRAERDMISRIVALGRRQVREIMRPRVHMPVILDDASVEEMIDTARRLKMRRIPLYDRHTDTVVGVLNARVLLMHPEIDLSEVIEPPAFVPETMSLLKLLRSMQRQRRDFAIVLDEFGDMAGYVMLEDILNETVGIPGFDRLVFERLGSGKWRVSGLLRIDDFRYECPQMPPVKEIETMGGLVTALLGEVPRVGQKVTFHKIKFTVLAADERSVKELLVELIP